MAEDGGKGHQPKHGRKIHWWDQMNTRRWVGTVTAAVVAAAIIAIPSGAWHILSGVLHRNSSPTKNPVQVESARYVYTNDPTFSFSQVLTGAQVRALTENKYFSGGQPRWNSWETYINLIAKYGGAPNEATIQIVLKDQANQTVTITDLRVVKRCTPPLTGTLLYSPGGAAPPDIRLWYTLDGPYPVAQYQNRSGKLLDFFSRKTIQLSPGAVNTLLVSATAYDHACTFRLVMSVDDGHGQVTETIGNGTRPFVVTATAGAYSPKPYLKASDYRAIYAGGDASPAGNATYVRVNPKTYRLLG